MSRKIFLYKDNSKDNDRDVVYYIQEDPERWECGHYFGSPHLCGACFSTTFNNAGTNYDNITTILTREEMQALMDFETAVRELGYGITKGDERYQKGTKLCNDIRPIYQKLLSKENNVLFDRIIEEETEWLMDEYRLDEKDVAQIFNEYGLDYRDRGVVSCVFDSIEDCAQEEARSLGHATNENDRWFNYDKYGEDLLEEERYLELSDGRIAYLNY